MPDIILHSIVPGKPEFTFSTEDVTVIVEKEDGTILISLWLINEFRIVLSDDTISIEYYDPLPEGQEDNRPYWVSHDPATIQMVRDDISNNYLIF